MKKQLFFLILLFCIMVLYGCNQDEENITNPPEDAPMEHENHNQNETHTMGENQDTTTKGNQTINDTNQNGLQNDGQIRFTSFDLDIEYDDNQEFDVDYENDSEGMEAELKDTIKRNEQLQGDEAFNRLSPLFESFTFDKNTPDDEVISTVLTAFNLDDNYRYFELEIDFEDGTTKEYNREK